MNNGNDDDMAELIDDVDDVDKLIDVVDDDELIDDVDDHDDDIAEIIEDVVDDDDDIQADTDLENEEKKSVMSEEKQVSKNVISQNVTFLQQFSNQDRGVGQPQPRKRLRNLSEEAYFYSNNYGFKVYVYCKVN